ncbi:phosphatase PAP2 family protein [Silvibacterium acidisoli]|uniref:phosphatase PAP2 family protein n=1 Tax=Acidobacteriaceae bacterium ZG23-2 TaxID=2883246 RepID=UPI00406BFCC0
MCKPVYKSFPMRTLFIGLLLVVFRLSGIAQVPAEKSCDISSLQICALHVAQDEAGIVTAPFHLRASSLLWIAPFGIATGVGIDKDAEAIQALGVDPNRERQFRRISDYGGIYGPTAAIFTGYVTGRVTHNAHLQETAVLAGEAMADSIILNKGLEYAINRQDPMQGDGTGRFWPHGFKTWPDGQSMPSDHSILVWSFAHVVASQYNGIATELLVYSLAATVSASRVIAREHFPTDVFVGSALGYGIGGYVVGRRSTASAWQRLSVSSVSTPNGRGMQLQYTFVGN